MTSRAVGDMASAARQRALELDNLLPGEPEVELMKELAAFRVRWGVR